MGSIKKEEKSRLELSKHCIDLLVSFRWIVEVVSNYTVSFIGSRHPIFSDWIIATNVYTKLSTHDFVQ